MAEFVRIDKSLKEAVLTIMKYVQDATGTEPTQDPQPVVKPTGQGVFGHGGHVLLAYEVVQVYRRNTSAALVEGGGDDGPTMGGRGGVSLFAAHRAVLMVVVLISAIVISAGGIQKYGHCDQKKNRNKP